MIVVIFRSRRRPEHEREYQAMAARMDALARTMPGFVDIRSYTAQDGEHVSVVEFTTEHAANAWREHPEHREAQRLGKERFYREYSVQVCVETRRYSFPG
jgi:heme-degrading monooxygenase HmoA